MTQDRPPSPPPPPPPPPATVGRPETRTGQPKQVFYNVVAPGRQIVSFGNIDQAIAHAEELGRPTDIDGRIVVQKVVLGAGKVGAAATEIVHEIAF